MNEAYRKGVQVISRAAAVLRSLEQEPNGLSIGEIAVRVGLPRSTVQRIVGALAQENLLMAATPKARVRLGPALVQLAAGTDIGLEKLARPIMRELSRVTEETVDLSVLGRDTAVFVEQIQGTQRLAAVSAVGMPFPLHCTANGKALLAQLKPERREQLLAGRLKRYTDATITERAELDSELRRVETSGLAFDLEEHMVGICSIGTAFRDSLCREYSISIPVPAARFPVKRQQLAKLLMKARTDLLDNMLVDPRFGSLRTAYASRC